MEKDEQNSNQSKIIQVAHFLFIWVCVGIPLGLFTVTAGPMKWLEDYATKTGMSDELLSTYSTLIVVGFIVVSVVIALLICRSLVKCGKRRNGTKNKGCE